MLTIHDDQKHKQNYFLHNFCQSTENKTTNKSIPNAWDLGSDKRKTF